MGAWSEAIIASPRCGSNMVSPALSRIIGGQTDFTHIHGENLN
jgi:hypothetical protein